MTLLDSLMPHYEVHSRHTTTIGAPPEHVAGVLESFRPDVDSPVVTRMLIRLRGLRTSGDRLRQALDAQGFTLIAETPGRELVFAIAGRFWALREQKALIRLASAEEFQRFDTPGCAAAALSVDLEPLEGGRTLLTTETRVRCVDTAARVRFRLYWTIVGRFSGMIRHDWLRTIKRLAES